MDLELDLERRRFQEGVRNDGEFGLREKVCGCGKWGRKEQMSEVSPKVAEDFQKLTEVPLKVTEDFVKLTEPIFQMTEPPVKIDRSL